MTDGPHSANYEIPIGILDDASGLDFASEIFIDHKPAAYTFAGDRTRLTRAETLARFGISEEGE